MGSEEMVRFFAVSVMVVLTMGAFLPAVHAQAPSPAPTSDGVAIDQGVAYVLLFAALVVTYVVHPLDAFPFNLF
ncbi:hypothetical protein O6H91_06G051300 [Diphasiastrum complanatum]|uniref:Uncharacterized protein n=1 Tax=Diphasiastrum complanatum TaxID=34168 RepID=A0ACC2DDJ0_DIPCM|nr:hypothetical protein O6H91_06G051300 [Diphasiastrum complanatum]